MNPRVPGAVCVLVLWLFPVEAQLVNYPGGATSTDFAPNVSAGELLAGDLTPGFSLSGITAEGNFDGSAGYEAAGWTTAAVPDDNSSWTFTVTALVGYNIHFTNLSFRFKSMETGPETIRADVSTPDIGRVAYPGGADTPMIQDTAGDYQATGGVLLLSGQTATFYILAYGAQSTSGSLIVDDLHLNGAAQPVPEPSTAGLALLGGFLAAVWRRRCCGSACPAILNRARRAEA